MQQSLRRQGRLPQFLNRLQEWDQKNGPASNTSITAKETANANQKDDQVVQEDDEGNEDDQEVESKTGADRSHASMGRAIMPRFKRPIDNQSKLPSSTRKRMKVTQEEENDTQTNSEESDDSEIGTENCSQHSSPEPRLPKRNGKAKAARASDESDDDNDYSDKCGTDRSSDDPDTSLGMSSVGNQKDRQSINSPVFEHGLITENHSLRSTREPPQQLQSDQSHQTEVDMTGPGEISVHREADPNDSAECDDQGMDNHMQDNSSDLFQELPTKRAETFLMEVLSEEEDKHTTIFPDWGKSILEILDIQQDEVSGGKVKEDETQDAEVTVEAALVDTVALLGKATTSFNPDSSHFTLRGCVELTIRTVKLFPLREYDDPFKKTLADQLKQHGVAVSMCEDAANKPQPPDQSMVACSDVIDKVLKATLAYHHYEKTLLETLARKREKQDREKFELDQQGHELSRFLDDVDTLMNFNNHGMANAKREEEQLRGKIDREADKLKATVSWDETTDSGRPEDRCRKKGDFLWNNC